MCVTKTTTKAQQQEKTGATNEAKANEDMNHRPKSVVRHVVKRAESRASYFFSQPLDGVELLLQGQTCISQDVEATEAKRTGEMA